MTGTSIGASLVRNDIDVYWISEGRSKESLDRAYANKFIDATKAELVLSTCPPENVISVAQRVAAHSYSGIFVDGNAVSPRTLMSIADLFGDRFVDGGIIWPPAWQSGSTRFYLSAKKAVKVATLFENSAS